MFSYCTERLHLSEPEAYLRIIAARASRKHPALLTLLRDGRLHLTAISLLAPHLTEANRDVVLARASHRTKRQIEELVAELSPRPDAPTVMRKIPLRPERSADPPRRPVAVAPSDGPLCPDGVGFLQARVFPPRPAVEPLAPARYKVQFTATAALREKLERLQALMRSQVPDGDLAAIIEQAVTEKLERLETRRFGSTKNPRKGLAQSNPRASSRNIPAPIKRFVATRDGMQCRYVDNQDRRCPERHRLEFHHQYPFGFGGDHRSDGLRLMCKAHNQLLAEHDYGRETIARHRRGEDPGTRGEIPTDVG
jgi:hypothetical protein